MKKPLLSLIAILLTITGMSANGHDPKAIDVTGIRMVKTQESVNVSFTIAANRRTVGSNDNLIIDPMLTDGANTIQLPSILIQGKKARISEQRRGAGSSTEEFGAAYSICNAEQTVYSATIPYCDWMEGAQLVFNGTTVRYNRSAIETPIGLIADDILHAEPQYLTSIVEVALPPKEILSTADRLSKDFSFLVPTVDDHDNTAPDSCEKEPSGNHTMPRYMGKDVRALDEHEMENFVNDNREGALSIYFRKGERVIDRYFGDNNKSMVELVSAVRAIAASDDSRIVHIVLAGFASPEGMLSFNKRLARNRALAMKKFLLDNTSVDPGLISVYNGEVDWSGLRQLVAESDLGNKDTVLDLIDNAPVWDVHRNIGRLGQIMRLDSGRTYRYMMQHFFPKLRNAAYIKIYYENLPR